MRWSFDINALYLSDPQWDASPLVAHFTEAEVLSAVRSMNVNNAPGLDGLGPAWYAAAWADTKTAVMGLQSSFHNGTADLNRINRAHIVLLLKKECACQPKDFRPISL